MSTQVAIRRGNTAQTAAFTGVVAELTVDTDKKVVVVHDGTTAGGNPLIKANASITTGQILTSNGSHLLALSNTGTAGVYGNASFIPVVTTDAYGRVSSVTNTAIAISSGVVTGVMTFAQGGANATSYTTGGLLTSNGTSFVSVANTGTAGTYANAAYIPVITTDAYGRVSAVTNTAVAIDTSQLISGTIADARLSDTGTAGTYANAAYIPVITTDSKGRVTAITNTAVAIDTSQLTSGTVADARLPTKGTAGTYANSTYIPVITTDAYGRVTAITNTVIQSSTTSVQGIVQLTDSISSTSTTTAATPNSVKTAYDLATTANTNAVNAGTYANAAFDKANSANVIAQAAFDNSNTKFNSSGGSISGDVSVTGNLTIIGQTIYANTSTALIADNIITLNAAINQASAPTVDAGFEIDRGSSANVSLLWNETSDKWTFTNDGTNYFNIADAGRLDSVFSLANGTAGVANTDYTTLTASAGTYGNASHVAVTTLTANGRVSLITNTAIAIDTGAITSGTLADARLPDTGTAGTYANASHVPVITTDSKGRVTAVTNTAITLSAASITSGTLAVAQGGTGVTTSTGTGNVVLNTSPVLTTPNIGTPSFATLTNATGLPIVGGTTGTLTIARGGTNQTTFNPGQRILFDGSSLASQANVTTTVTGGLAAANTITALTTNDYGDIIAFTGAAIAIDTAQITSGTIADARLPTTGTAGVYGNNAFHPVITTDAYGRVTAVTNTLVQIAASQVTSGVLPFAQGGANNTTYTTGAILTSNGTAFVALANTGTAGTYANASHVPVITTDAYGRVSAVTNTAIAIDTAAITSGTIADARLPTTGTAGTYANATHVPVITTDAYGRVTAVTNTAISFPVTSVGGQTGAVSNTQLLNSILSVDGTGSGLDADLLDGLESASFANAAFANTRFSSTGGSITGDVTVTGNLTIVGQTVYANTSTALIADNIITLNAAIGQASAPTVNAGIEVDRGSSANVLLLWNETTDKWQFTNDGSTYFDVADAGRLDSAFALANGTAGVANTDYTTISTTAGVYGNASHVTVTTLTANGRVSSITNTAIAIDTGAITSGTIADARLPTKGTAGTYGNTTYVPVITTDAYGRVTGVTNTAIQSGTTSVSGIVQLTDSISSTSTTTAATPNSVKTAYDYAQSAFTKANQTAQLAFTTVSANGTSLVADANNDTLTITAASANGIFINADAGTDALDIGLRNSGVTSGTYGNNTTAVTITVDAFGRITSVSNAAISGGATLGDVLALSIALG